MLSYVSNFRDAAFIKEMGLKLKYVMNTHCHADHITSTGVLKRDYFAGEGVQSVISKASTAKADLLVNHGDMICFGGRYVYVRSTPGHTEVKNTCMMVCVCAGVLCVVCLGMCMFCDG